ncbi:nucleotide-binding protein [Paraburkholderia dipogonis]|uniref:Nucleotide-binding protein n=1 Tax=Paraburkholderia dipogonis TaxID=1211383 RepID=A0ABW9B5J4_9BURK
MRLRRKERYRSEVWPGCDCASQTHHEPWDDFLNDPENRSRSRSRPERRGNVVFEIGLFMGRLGKDRAFLMEPGDYIVKLPSDLTGITAITYRYKPSGDAADGACLQPTPRAHPSAGGQTTREYQWLWPTI